MRVELVVMKTDRWIIGSNDPEILRSKEE